MKVLRDYQVKLLRRMRRVPHAAVFLEMRLGKTLIMIRHIKMLPFQDSGSILVIAPYSALSGWREELKEEKQEFIQLEGLSRKRTQTLNNYPRWVLTNKESLLYVPMIKQIAWDIVVLDESTFIKNPNARVSKIACKYFRSAQHRYILTGTPAPESELDYFMQIHFLDHAILGYNSFWDFRVDHCYSDGSHCRLKNKSKPWFAKQISKHSIFLTRKDVGLDNEKIYEHRVLKLPPVLQRLYTQMEKDFLMDISEGVTVSTMFAGAKWAVLRQLCGGFIDKELKHDFKISETISLVKNELCDESIVIWCSYIHEIKELYYQMVAQGIRSYYICGEVTPMNRDEIRKEFQNGTIRVLVAQPEVWKYGTTLSRASAMIYFSSPTSGLTRSQTEDRTINIAKQNSALIIDMVCEGTVEEDILTGLKEKQSQDSLMRSVIHGIQQRSDC